MLLNKNLESYKWHHIRSPKSVISSKIGDDNDESKLLALPATSPFTSPSGIRQKSESQNECYKKTKRVKFSEKRTFLTPW